MSSDTAIRIITRADLRDPDYWKEWTWPAEVPPITGTNRNFMLEHPLARGEGDPIQILALTGTQIVGRVNLICGRLQVEGRDVDVLWGSALAVPERFRHTSAGLMLMLRMSSVHHTTCVVGISQMVTPIYEKLRWTMFPMTRYVLLRKSMCVLDALFGARAARIARPIADSLLSVHGGLLRAFIEIRARGLVVEYSETLPEEMDTSLRTPRAPVTCYRSSEYVNSLLNHRVDSRYLRIVRDRDGRMLGYFIVTSRFHESAADGKFKNIRLGTIKEWMILQPDRLDELQMLLLATRELCKDVRLDAIEVCLPDDAHGGALRLLGFVAKGDLKLLFKAGPKSPLSLEKYQDRRTWWFRPADGDYFFV